MKIQPIHTEDIYQKPYPVKVPKPVEAIKLRMDQLGMQQKGLAKVLGSKSRASEILSAKRSLSLRHIKLLYKKLGIPAEVLIQETEPIT